MSKNINTLIDLGSNNLKCAIFSYEGKKSNLIAFSEKKTQGIHNSIITNFDEACESLNSVISDVEKKFFKNVSWRFLYNPNTGFDET